MEQILSNPEPNVINPWQWQDALGFAQAVETHPGGHTLYCAGQASVGADGAPLHAGDMLAQMHAALDNLQTVLTQAGYAWPTVVRLNYYTTDVDLFFAHYGDIVRRLGEVECRPSSTLLGVSRLAFPELMVEMEATAVR